MADAPGEEAQPAVLRGPSAARLIALGRLVSMVATVCVIPIAFESDFKSDEALWAGTWFTLFLLLVGYGVVAQLLGFRKRVAEVGAGYTTLLTMYSKNRDLYLLDPRTADVLREPMLRWRSQAFARQVSAMRGDLTFNPDDSRYGAARARSEIHEIDEAGAARRDAEHPGKKPARVGNPPVARRAVVVALVAPLLTLGVGLGIVIHALGTSGAHAPGQGRINSLVLSHTSVEGQIEVFEQTTGVLCNGGKDITVVGVGQTFGCSTVGGAQYTVTITNAQTGTFTVS